MKYYFITSRKLYAFYVKSMIPLKKCLCLCGKINMIHIMLYVCLSWGSKECLYVFNRIRTSHDAAPYSPCCASHLTCYCMGLLTVWSLWGNPGMARCRKKSALAFGYIQKPKALLASSSGKSSSMGGTSGGATGQVASTLRYIFFLFF